MLRGPSTKRLAVSWAGMALVAILAPASPASTAQPELAARGDTAPIPGGADGEAGERGFAPSASVAYDNLLGDASSYYAGQGGHEALDDIHGVEAGDVSAVTFRYYDPGSPASPGAWVTVYSNPSGLDAGAEIVAGPTFVGGLVTGVLGTATVSFPGQEPVGSNLWVGVRFSSETAGLVLNADPVVGLSHDYYREDGNLFWFGGNPVANFSIRVELGAAIGIPDGGPTATTPLGAPWPNPMRLRTSVLVSLEESQRARLSVYTLQGRLVTHLTDEVLQAGSHAFQWNGRDDGGKAVPAGVYFMRLAVAERVVSRRILVMP